jgi:hypothetical protein
MTRNAAFFLALPLLVATSTVASADTAVEKSFTGRFSFGARAGGFGFRNTEHADAGKWDDCRMDGIGVFAQRSLTPHLFAEAAFDLYTAADATPTADMPQPEMDRISGITTVAAGARMPWRWVAPYVQLGVGLEVTRVEMASHGATDRAVSPMGFVGFGLEGRPTERFSIGLAARTNLIRHYEHGAAAEGADHDHSMSTEVEAAAQGQLFVKLEM